MKKKNEEKKYTYTAARNPFKNNILFFRHERHNVLGSRVRQNFHFRVKIMKLFGIRTKKNKKNKNKRRKERVLYVDGLCHRSEYCFGLRSSYSTKQYISDDVLLCVVCPAQANFSFYFQNCDNCMFVVSLLIYIYIQKICSVVAEHTNKIWNNWPALCGSHFVL